MIPKLIHYCWFGQKPLPELALKCIASWKKFLPDYEIKEWNEVNFDVNQTPYSKQAYKCKKYAFVSDYARFKIMHKYGGVYFDTDVEVIRPLDDIVAKGSFFGTEAINNKIYCNPGLGFGCEAGQNICSEMIKQYERSTFFLPNGKLNLKTVVIRFSETLKEQGFVFSPETTEFKGLHFYSPEYFSPIDFLTRKNNISPKTRTVHHYAASWVNKYDNMSWFAKLWNILHLPNTNIRSIIKKLPKH